MASASLPALVAAIYESTFEDEAGFRTLFARIAKATGVVACGIKTEWSSTDTVEQNWFGLPEGFERAFVAEYWREDPWTRASRDLAAGTVFLSQQVISDAALERTRFHAELCVPYGLHDALGTCLLRDKERYVTFGLMRPVAPRGDGKREAVLTAELVPHLTRMMLLRLEAKRLRADAGAARAGLEDLPFAALVLDAACQVVSTNAAADEMLRTAAGLVSTSSGLVTRRSQDTRALHRAVAAAIHSQRRSSREVVTIHRLDDCPLAAIVTPVPRQDGVGRVLLYVLDPHASAEPTEKFLRTVFALSPAETQVALCIARGLRPEQVATTLARSLATIRSQLRAVFRKTRTTRQAELSRILASLGARGA